MSPPGPRAIFLGFARIGLLGFGGVAAWARHVIVEERRWLTEREYAETAGLAQVLPGPNVGTAGIFIGRHFAGWRGAVAATAGLYVGPLVILLLGWVGIVRPETLSKNRRYAIFVIAIVAAIVTPTSDLLSMSLMMIPLYLLYELGILLLKIAPPSAVGDGTVLRGFWRRMRSGGEG